MKDVFTAVPFQGFPQYKAKQNIKDFLKQNWKYLFYNYSLVSGGIFQTRLNQWLTTGKIEKEYSTKATAMKFIGQKLVSLKKNPIVLQNYGFL